MRERGKTMKYRILLNSKHGSVISNFFKQTAQYFDCLSTSDCLDDIANHFKVSQATISYHLSQLKKAELIFERKEKNFIYYELNTTIFEEIMIWLAQFKEVGKNEEKDK